jgi:hypothetical protein
MAEETPVYVEFAVPGGQRIGIYERQSFEHWEDSSKDR